jgi:hypothetical protein
MIITERIQTLIHALEVKGSRWMNYAALMLAVLALALWYDTHCYVDFSAPEAMDAAQVARNIAEGRGFTTQFIRPFSVRLLQKHNHAAPAQPSSSNSPGAARLNGDHPDLANAPLYPLVLAGLMALHMPAWPVEVNKPFWADGGRFQRYQPEFLIAVFNQILLLVAVWLTFLVARTLFDAPAAWLAAILMLASDTLWRFSVSGLPTLLMLVILLGVTWCIATFEATVQAPNASERRRILLAVAAGLLTGLGMLTRYSFGWLILPVALYFILFGRTRRVGLAITSILVFGVVVAPWIARNLMVSGTPFGTAGYAVMECTFPFPGSRLMQSLSPDMTSAHWLIPYLVKLQANVRVLLQDDVPRLGGGWMGILFYAGLLLGLRNVVARHLRYFTMMCLGVLVIVSALGQTEFSLLSPDMNSENLLVLLMPLAVIFGVGFFLTLLSQMQFPALSLRYGAIALAVLLLRLQFVFALLPPRTSPIAYPPYYPPDIQKFSAWIEPKEWMMSDVPWAVAWYGDRQCTWTTLNCQYEFVALNDFIKPVSGLYLTLQTLNGKLLTECIQGGVDNWSNFAYKTLVYNQLPDKFPLRQFPLEALASGLFLTDRQRW